MQGAALSWAKDYLHAGGNPAVNDGARHGESRRKETPEAIHTVHASWPARKRGPISKILTLGETLNSVHTQSNSARRRA